jgi:hypothetical protein
MGAAHTLNNAFTEAIAEAGFLLEDHKDTAPELAESCQLILASLDRCARITRGLLARDGPPRAEAEAEADLVRAIQTLCPLLEETLGSRYALRASLPDDLVLVPGSPADLELLLLVWIQFAADHSGPTAELEIQLVPDAADSDESRPVALHLHVDAPSLAAGVVEAFVDPAAASDPVTRLCLEALDALLAGLGARKHGEQTSATSWTASLRLPSVVIRPEV